MKKEYKISICMMIKDEERNLVRCLDSIKPIIDSGLGELIIVDTGSNDKSIDIAKNYTDKVYLHKWNKNFSEMRNITISYAKGEWIFILDADERVDDCEKLIKLMNNFKDIEKFNTILLEVKNLYDLNNEKKYNLMISSRMFRNDDDFRYEGSIHNQPISKEPNLKVDIQITHFGYIKNDKELMERKFKRTSELLNIELMKDPNNIYYIYQLGVSYEMYGNKDEAIKQFRKAYNLLRNKIIEERKLYIFLYGAYCKLAYTINEKEESIKIAKEGLKLEKNYIDLYYILAMSEKELGNIRTSFKYFNEYLNLVNNYNSLDVSKDMRIVMYLIDENCISNAYFELYQYCFNRNDYKNSYEYYKKIINYNQKIYCGINILIKLKKYKELKELYDNLKEKEYKNIFLSTLENKLKNISDIEKKEIYRVFSLNEDIYGELNKLRIIENENKYYKLAILLLNKIDFNDSLELYYEVFKYLKRDIETILEKFKDIEVLHLRNIINELIKDKDIKEKFENYILELRNNINNIEDLKVKISILYIIMISYIENNSQISNKYLEIFKLYIKYGVEFVSSIYQIEKAEDIYKYISSEEDRFFILMYIIEKNIKLRNKKTAIKYMLEVIHLNKGLIKYVEIYKDEILNFEEKDENKNINEEFENYKIMIKKNIITLIDSKNLNDAKQIISEYEKLVKDDVEIYSMKAIIYIIEDDLYEAKSILEEGLRLYPENEDLLYNLNYLLSESDFNRNRRLLN